MIRPPSPRDGAAGAQPDEKLAPGTARGGKALPPPDDDDEELDDELDLEDGRR